MGFLALASLCIAGDGKGQQGALGAEEGPVLDVDVHGPCSVNANLDLKSYLSPSVPLIS